MQNTRDGTSCEQHVASARIIAGLQLRPPVSSPPRCHLCAHPKSSTARAQVDHRTWHVGVALQVEADTVHVAQPQDLSNAAAIRKIIWIDTLSHNAQSSEPWREVYLCL